MVLGVGDIAWLGESGELCGWLGLSIEDVQCLRLPCLPSESLIFPGQVANSYQICCCSMDVAGTYESS